ncbi:MAG: division/cell wall cluster transcriptional repressor MraZ [Deltaproteobacteria bacterium]|nr:division/cell wall cluster transcriptional repressor MraZ [Deltaproteobacteria bacterium]
MFRGRHEHTIDAKGRLSVPRVFRDDLIGGEESPPMLVNQRDHLTLFPAKEWAAIEEQLLEMSSLDPDAQRLRRFYASGSVPCPIDSQGRILVPGFLREHAHLDNRVIVAGVLERVEIWNPAIFEASQAATMHELDDIQRTVDQITRS